MGRRVMKTYYISQFPRPSIEIEIEGVPPCLFCGEPVSRPSMDGPLVCGACDCGSNRDGSKWTSAQSDARWQHRLEQVAKYREVAAHRASARQNPCAHDWVRYVLDDSTASHAQKDGIDAAGRPYRDVPMWPVAAFAYAATIGSDFASRVVEQTCVGCGAVLDAGMARLSDPMPRYGASLRSDAEEE